MVRKPTIEVSCRLDGEYQTMSSDGPSWEAMQVARTEKGGSDGVCVSVFLHYINQLRSNDIDTY